MESSTDFAGIPSSSNINQVPSKHKSKRPIQSVSSPINSETNGNKRLRVSSSIVSPTDNLDSSFVEDSDALTPDTTPSDEDSADEDYLNDEYLTPSKLKKSKGKSKAVETKSVAISDSDDEFEAEYDEIEGEYAKIRVSFKGKGKAMEMSAGLLSATDDESGNDYFAKIPRGGFEDIYNSDNYNYRQDEYGGYAIYKGNDEAIPELGSFDQSDFDSALDSEDESLDWRVREKKKPIFLISTK